MKKSGLALGLGLAGVATWAYSRRTVPQSATIEPGDQSDQSDQGGTFSWIPENLDFWTQHNQNETETKADTMPAPIDTARNLAAFLHAIARAEGTANQADPYRVCFGYKFTIADYADHPASLGVWKGEPLSAAMCKAAGFGQGCVSTAAGKYQIVKPTWQRLKTKLKLRDFSPASQDAAATELLRETGALELAQRGEVREAAFAARRTWASLPGAGYDQPERTVAWLQNQFTSAGGTLA